jgi:excisionase family DNA binding protein
VKAWTSGGEIHHGGFSIMGQILTRAEAANFLKIPRRTIDYLVATGQIPFSRIGRRNVRFDQDRLEEWFREREGIEYRRGSNK